MDKIGEEWATERKKLDPKWERKYDDPIFKDLWEERRAKEKVVNGKKSCKFYPVCGSKENCCQRSGRV